MSRKETGRKKYSPTFLQRNKKKVYYGSFVLAVTIVLFLFNNKSLLGSSDNDGSLPSDFSISAGMPPVQAPNFSLTTVEGKHLKLSDYKGKVVIVDFWATWCPPCRRGIPDLIELKKKYGTQGFEIIGISVDQETKGDVPSFVQQKGINYPVVYADNTVTERYGGINSIPSSFVIDKEGKIVASYQGLTSITVYENHIKKLLGL